MNSYPLQAHAMPHQLPHDTHRHALPPPMSADVYSHNPPPPSHMPHGHLPPMAAQGPPAGYEGYPPGPPPEMSTDKKPTVEELANTHDALVPKTRTDGGRRYVYVLSRLCSFFLAAPEGLRNARHGLSPVFLLCFFCTPAAWC